MQLTRDDEMIMAAAQKSYEGYCAYTSELPTWHSLKDEIKNAWLAAAKAAIKEAAAGGLLLQPLKPFDWKTLWA